MLTLDEQHTPDELVERTIRASESLKRSEIRFKSLLYPEAGLLAFLGDDTNDLNEVLTFKDALDQEAPFRWQKDMNVKVAVNILVSHQLRETNTIQTGLFTTLETILQAQQAATLAGVTATTALLPPTVADNKSLYGVLIKKLHIGFFLFIIVQSIL
ncbi:DUF4003 family protein [Thalassobacillus devorans]|uniref:DUF4003 family protein n=1 Tax=Thalassobacillus devorans TaxID=279813 RepID=UPI0004AF7150|nr:DUF4003 family protein [Thalassobacillus devorans]